MTDIAADMHIRPVADDIATAPSAFFETRRSTLGGNGKTAENRGLAESVDIPYGKASAFVEIDESKEIREE